MVPPKKTLHWWRPVALNLADNTDARMETITEILQQTRVKKSGLDIIKLFESNLRRTDEV